MCKCVNVHMCKLIIEMTIRALYNSIKKYDFVYMCICVNVHIYTNTHRGGSNMEEYEAGYEELYACEYCGVGFMEGAYNNEVCDNCAIEQGLLD